MGTGITFNGAVIGPKNPALVAALAKALRAVANRPIVLPPTVPWRLLECGPLPEVTANGSGVWIAEANAAGERRRRYYPASKERAKELMQHPSRDVRIAAVRMAKYVCGAGR